MRIARLISALPAVCVLIATAASGATVDDYLQIRRKSGFDPKLNYAQIQASAATYSKKVFEMRGRADGYIQREKAISFLLTLEDRHSILVNAPDADVRLVTGSNHQLLRVLARVGDGNTGNVVPIDVIAVAYDAEVSAREQDAAAREQTAVSVRPIRSARSSQAQPMSVSRGGYYARRIPGSGGNVSALALQSLKPEGQKIYPAYRDFIIGCNPRLSEDELDKITVSLLYAAQQNHVDPRLVVAVIIAESDFNPRSTSNKGAMGLGQLMPDEVQANHLTNPYDPVQNILTSVGLLRGKLDRYRTQPLPEGQYSVDQIVLALAAYNAGPGAVKKYGGVPPYKETQGYVKKIMRIYRQLCGPA